MFNLKLKESEQVIEDGSVFKVPFTTIKNITNHPDADRLEIATVYDFQVVIQKGKFVIGDKVIFIPIDSILSEKLEPLLFSKDSKIKLDKRRVRQIRIRKFPSQGMLVSPEEVSSIINPKFLKDEYDLKEVLGITKYEPPVLRINSNPGRKQTRNKRYENPLFHKFNGLANLKWFPDLFEEREQVIVQEKVHGTNSRAAVLPYSPNTLLKKIKLFLKLSPSTENCYGSNNVEISANTSYKGYYGEDIYGSVFAKLDVFNKIKLGETVFGEIIGPSIQKNYEYGLKEHKFLLFDVKVLQEDSTQKWLNPDEVEQFAKERGFDMVPILYKGPFNKEFVKSLASGPSLYCKEQKVIEGVVVKALNYDIEGNKKALKVINPAYLDDVTNTDNH